MKLVRSYPQIIIHYLKNLSIGSKIILLVLIFITQIVITFIVYIAGGIQYVYSHGMYIPIMIGAFAFGRKFGVLIAIIGGFLLGPFMPINTTTGLMQLPINWIYRMVFFVIIGFGAGMFSEINNQYYLEKIKRLTFFGDTTIHRPEILDEYFNKQSHLQRSEYNILMIRINNSNNIIDVFGSNEISNLLVDISTYLHKKSPGILGVYARSFDGLIVCYHKEYHEQVLKIVLDQSLKTHTISNVQIFINLSIGITELSDNLNESISQASIASSEAFGSNQEFRFYSGEIGKSSINLEILGSVIESIHNNCFHLVFQPKVNISSGKYIGAECLIRWNHPHLGNIPPNDFIPLIENTNLINTLTNWIIQKVLSLLNEYRNVYDAEKYPIAINLSVSNLTKDHQLYNNIIRMLDDSKLGRNVIQFEITETLLMQNPKESIEVIKDLKNHHVNFSIDDFGTGYSSFEYLSQLGVSEIKIDRVFISKMVKSSHDLFLVKATINLAKFLDIETVAEGVETKEEADILAEIDCDYAQGYYIARPMTFESLLEFISNQDRIY